MMWAFSSSSCKTLILPAQLFVLGGQRIPLRLRTPLLRKSFVYRAIALLAPAVQRRGVDSFPPQNGADTAAIRQGAISSLLKSASSLQR